MSIVYFDCYSGASGDMIVGALLDAGASVEHLRNSLATLPISGFEISAEKIRKQGFAATSFIVRSAERQPHRHLHHVTDIIRAGRLSDRVVGQACRIFERLAEAEAAVHGTTIEKVHFHEVGAVDAIVDIVGACIALEELGGKRVCCSPIPTGSGTVECDHGVLPIPAPATAHLLRGVPIATCDEAGELTTPTGAAILTTLAESFGPVGGITIRQIGCGAGQREGRNRPNLLRVLIGDSLDSGESDEVVVLEANIDDQSPQLVAHAVGRLLERGALDAFCQPIHMKKGRTGLLLTVLCGLGQVEDMESLIFAETTTFGIRRHVVQRSKLERRLDAVALPRGSVRVKVGKRAGRILTVSPEFEDCRQLAEQLGVPVKDIMIQAMQAWRSAGLESEGR